jgi:pyruvate ferredoxin oxidoreductase alpha subunit
MFPEVCAAAACEKMPKMYNFVYGLGGADTMVSDFMSAFKQVLAGSAKKVSYLGVDA